jgi:hypothetical protein
MGLIIDEPDEINTGSKIYPKDIINHTVLVWATDYIAHSPTQYNDGSDPKKPCDVVVVDVVDLDQLDADTGVPGLVARGSWWRQGRLIQRLRPRVGKPNPLLGRIVKGLGPNGAFELMDLSADQKALARANAWWAATGGIIPSGQENEPAPAEVRVSAQTYPTPDPSPLEAAANQSLGRPVTSSEQNTLDRLRRLGAQSNTFNDQPPF